MRKTRIAQRFIGDSEIVDILPVGGGNINDTYLVIHKKPGLREKRFILQRLNRTVFPSPDVVMHNMKVVTEHIRKRVEEESLEADRAWQFPHIIPTTDGEDYVIDAGECWRAIYYVVSAQTHLQIADMKHAHEAGVVLGEFHRLIADIPGDQLKDALPGFHITPQYLNQLDGVVSTAEGQERLNSVPEAERCYRFIEKRRDICSILEDAKARGELSERPIHGDPKAANIMIADATCTGVGIIDFDTVKSGLMHYDFGDCMRSCCNPVGEEPDDVATVHFDPDMCEAITRGYMTAAGPMLTDEERYYLYDSIRIITLELGIRFFADFLAGDHYFKVHDEFQNLRRARAQLKLCKSIEKQESEIRGVLATWSRTTRADW